MTEIVTVPAREVSENEAHHAIHMNLHTISSMFSGSPDDLNVTVLEHAWDQLSRLKSHVDVYGTFKKYLPHANDDGLDVSYSFNAHSYIFSSQEKAQLQADMTSLLAIRDEVLQKEFYGMQSLYPVAAFCREWLGGNSGQVQCDRDQGPLQPDFRLIQGGLDTDKPSL